MVRDTVECSTDGGHIGSRGRGLGAFAEAVSQ